MTQHSTTLFPEVIDTAPLAKKTQTPNYQMNDFNNSFYLHNRHLHSALKMKRPQNFQSRLLFLVPYTKNDLNKQ